MTVRTFLATGLALAWALPSAPAPLAGQPQDPWPETQRTTNRLGRCDWNGPHVPVLAWQAQVVPGYGGPMLHANPILDAQGRLFVVVYETVVALEAETGETLWTFTAGRDIVTAPSLWQGRLLFGSLDGTFYCLDAATSAVLWSVYDPDSKPFVSQVADSNGLIYHSDYRPDSTYILARSIADGGLVWSVPTGCLAASVPSLHDPTQRLYIGAPCRFQWECRSTRDGEVLWSSAVGRDEYGLSPIENNRVYVASRDWNLYAFDATTGQELWQFYAERYIVGDAAIGHDGDVYVATAGGINDWLYRISPDGEEIWRFPLQGYDVLNAPIIAGDGTIYISCWKSDGTPGGRVYAVNPNGTLLWQYDLPDKAVASPTIGPDGTLYVLCYDRNVYAFRDWERAAPTGLTVLRGLVISGGLPDLFDSDDSRLVVQTGQFAPSTEPPVQIEVTGTSPTETPSELKFRFEGMASRPFLERRILLYNYVTQSYEELHVGFAATSDEVIEIVVTANASRFVEPGTQQVKSLMTWRAAAFSFFTGWNVGIDQTIWRITH
ncbi:MAG: PQQ-like beta-propeller repeat protein [Armatimonadetes bacterium]|nr:PQQ-like beta-propeller repeat protein [Armatimonadota bacterium]